MIRRSRVAHTLVVMYAPVDPSGDGIGPENWEGLVQVRTGR